MASARPGKIGVRSRRHQNRKAIQTREMLENLAHNGHRLSIPLLDAAVAGIVLEFRPFDLDMRLQAAHAWKTLQPVLAGHLLNEDKNLLPWMEKQPQCPSEITEKLKRRHIELQALVRAIEPVSFETSDDATVAKAGKTLCLLAMMVDDLVSDDEMSVIPLLKHFVFGASSAQCEN